MRPSAALLGLLLCACRMPDATIAAPAEPAEPTVPPEPEAPAPEPIVPVQPTTDDHDQPSLVRLSDDGERVELLEPVQWEDAWSGRLVPDQQVLDDLAALLRALPELRVEIQAHESPREDLYGMKPTDRQADRILDWLVEQGIDSRRLTSKGYGETRPIADNATAAGRAANNRIEIWIVTDRD